MKIPGYTIFEKVLENAAFSVYKGKRNADNIGVLIKLFESKNSKPKDKKLYTILATEDCKAEDKAQSPAGDNAKLSLEFKEQSQELQQIKALLAHQHSLVSLGTLTAGIMHEIKNPLNFIINFASLSGSLLDEISSFLEKLQNLDTSMDIEIIEEIEEVEDSISMAKENIDNIHKQGERASSIIKHMLALTRDSSEYVETDINGLTEEFLLLSYHEMRARDPSFNVKYEKKYDPTLQTINIIPQDISRVLLNIFNNSHYALAQRQTEEGFKPTMLIQTQKLDNLCKISIKDNGFGIPIDIADKVFSPFFTTKPVEFGTGLGLSISMSIIQNHKGSLTFNTKEGEFTEFIITLPINEAN